MQIIQQLQDVQIIKIVDIYHYSKDKNSKSWRCSNLDILNNIKRNSIFMDYSDMTVIHIFLPSP